MLVYVWWYNKALKKKLILLTIAGPSYNGYVLWRNQNLEQFGSFKLFQNVRIVIKWLFFLEKLLGSSVAKPPGCFTLELYH